MTTALLLSVRATSSPCLRVSGLNTLSFYLAIAASHALELNGRVKYHPMRFRAERRSRRPGLKPVEVAQSVDISSCDVALLSCQHVLHVSHDRDVKITHVDAGHVVR